MKVGEPETAPLLDAHVVEELRVLIGPDGLRESIALFLSGAEENLAALREAQQEDDQKAIARAAHSLLGSCAIIGARRMAELAARLEHLARDGARGDSIAELLERLEREYANTRSALEAEA